MNIILVAYKIEKGLGSEDGSGYHIIKNLIKPEDKITLISRVNNIEKLKNDSAFKGVTLIGIDVPQPLSFFKKKGRGIILYYYLWQYFVGRCVNRLQSEQQVDVIHQLNFHADWAPHFFQKKTAKIIHGPIAHHATLPTDFQFGNKWLGITKEWIKHCAKHYFWLCDPFVKRAIKRSDVIFFANENLAPPFQKYTNKIRYQLYGGSIFSAHRKKDMTQAFQVLFVGRFVNLKGCIPAIDAFARFVKSTDSSAVMTFIGQGVLENEIKARADFHSIAHQVKFIAWLKQSDLIQHYQSAHVFLYPSFEAQGLVVTEALSSGCPVICLDKTGPSYLAGDAGLCVEQTDYQTTVTKLSQKLETVYTAFEEKDPYQTLVNRAVDRYQNSMTWDKIANQLRSSYDG